MEDIIYRRFVGIIRLKSKPGTIKTQSSPYQLFCERAAAATQEPTILLMTILHANLKNIGNF